MSAAEGLSSGMSEGAYLLARIVKNCESVGDCLVWKLRCNRKSPAMNIGRVPFPVRRIMFANAIGPILPGHDVISTCQTFKCVAPEHLVQIERTEHRRQVCNAWHAKRAGKPFGLGAWAAAQADSEAARANTEVAVQAARSGATPNSVFALGAHA